jgi:hypothetical protein
MTSSGRSVLLDPAEYVRPGCRLFIDTNIFMDVDPARKGRLKRLFERCGEQIIAHRNPVIVPVKVIDELTKQSRLDRAGLSQDRSSAAGKAKKALELLDDAETKGLVRKDLGDHSNPYADDLFVRVFEKFADQFEMCLLTNDVTLLLRIRMLAGSTGRKLLAGQLTQDGMIQLSSLQDLLHRGQSKLRRKQAEGDSREAGELEPLLADFQRLFGAELTEERRIRAVRTGHRARAAHTAPAARRSVVNAFSPATELREPDRVLKVADIPGEGETVLLESPLGSGAFVLGAPLGEGGEGAVFPVGGGWVVKIFDREHNTQHRKEKVSLLVAGGFRTPGICFPQALVTNQVGQFVGYLMPEAKGREFQRTIFNPRRFKQAYPDWKKTDLVDVCISFLEKVACLHARNIILGDINPKNLMVDARKEVWIIDADSWQLAGYPCPVGTPMFTAPSALGKPYSDSLRTMEEELFAVATMLFMILITGQFPYARAGSDGDITRLIQEGNFAFQYKENSNRDQPDGNWKYMWSHLQPGIKGMFWNTFHRDGDRYGRRPSADEWLRAFREYKRWLASGSNFDPMSNDVYPTRFRAMAADTPIYECAQCTTSMVGRWHQNTETYSTPRLCRDCQQNRPKCQDCGKSAALSEGRCRECNRQRKYGNCAGCGTEVRRDHLVDGRCSSCQLVTCGECGQWAQKSQMSHGRCPACEDKTHMLDSSRLCTRCGRPFITNGNVAWHQRAYKPVPNSHKVGDPDCWQAPSAPTQRAGQAAWQAQSRQYPYPPVPAPQQSLLSRLAQWLRDD